MELNAAVGLLKSWATAPGELATLVSQLLLLLCAGCTAALDCIVAVRCTLAIADATGAPQQRSMSGVQILLHTLQDPNGTETSRANAAALLGLCAPRPVTLTAAPTAAEVDLDDAAEASEQPVRVQLFHAAALAPMLQALFDVTALWVKQQPPPAAEGCSGKAATRRTLRATATLSSVQRRSPWWIDLLCCRIGVRLAQCCRAHCFVILHANLHKLPGRHTCMALASRSSSYCGRMQTSKEALAPPTPEAIAASMAAQSAAAAGIAAMAFGQPPEAREELCTSLLKALKSATPATKMAACQLLARMSAVAATRLTLRRQQALPLLVACCATGARLAARCHTRRQCTTALYCTH